MVTIQKFKLMFKVSPFGLQTVIDAPKSVLEDRVQYSTVHITNVFCDSHLQIISYVSNGIVRFTENFWSPYSWRRVWYFVGDCRHVVADTCGHDGSVSIENRYGLDDLGFESLCVWIIRTHPDRPWAPTQPPYVTDIGSFPGVKRPERVAEFKETSHKCTRNKPNDILSVVQISALLVWLVDRVD